VQSAPAPAAGNDKSRKTGGKRARIVSFRDDAGQFRFRLLAASGQELLLSDAFQDPKAAGAAMKALQSSPTVAVPDQAAGVAQLSIEGAVVSRFDADILASVNEALLDLARE